MVTGAEGMWRRFMRDNFGEDKVSTGVESTVTTSGDVTHLLFMTGLIPVTTAPINDTCLSVVG